MRLTKVGLDMVRQAGASGVSLGGGECAGIA